MARRVPLPDTARRTRWARTNALVAAAFIVISDLLGLLGSVSMAWAYGPRGFLLTAVVPTALAAVVVAAVVTVATVRSGQRPVLRSAWSKVTVWTWLAVTSPLAWVGVLTVSATPAVHLALFAAAGLLASVAAEATYATFRARRR